MITEIRQLWGEHLNEPFPSNITEDEIEGEDLVSLDTYTAGCVSSLIDNSGSLGQNETECLRRCYEGLSKVIPQLEGESKAYYSRLCRMSEIALELIGESRDLD